MAIQQFHYWVDVQHTEVLINTDVNKGTHYTLNSITILIRGFQSLSRALSR